MEKRGLRDIELKLISELLKNSRRSDRALAKSIGVSQTTIGRLIKKLWKEGFLKEYTVIPDFSRLGYEILALTFVKLKGTLVQDEIDKIRNIVREGAERNHYDIVTLNRGRGLGSDFLIVSFHKDYGSFTNYGDFLRQYGFFEDIRDSFLISLLGERNHPPFTMSALAKRTQMALTADALRDNSKKESEIAPRLERYPFLLVSGSKNQISKRD